MKREPTRSARSASPLPATDWRIGCARFSHYEPADRPPALLYGNPGSGRGSIRPVAMGCQDASRFRGEESLAEAGGYNGGCPARAEETGRSAGEEEERAAARQAIRAG